MPFTIYKRYNNFNYLWSRTATPAPIAAQQSSLYLPVYMRLCIFIICSFHRISGLFILVWVFWNEHFDVDSILAFKPHVDSCIISTRFSVATTSIQNDSTNWTEFVQWNSTYPLLLFLWQSEKKTEYVFMTFPPVSVRLPVRNEWNKTWSHACSSYFIRNKKETI